MVDLKRFYNTVEAASYLGLSESYLQNMRHDGRGPKYHKVGRGKGRVLYDRKDLDSWVKKLREEDNAQAET